MAVVIEWHEGKKQATLTIDVPANTGSKNLSTLDLYSTVPYLSFNQRAKSRFSVIGKDDGKLYAQGRIIEYMGGSYWNEYSFLDGVSTAQGFKMDPIYSCEQGSGAKTFRNGIVINDTQGNVQD